MGSESSRSLPSKLFFCVDFLDFAQILANDINFSVGDIKSLALHPYSTTHQQVSDADRPSTGVTGDMIRFSAGIEHVEDLKKDFQQSFCALEKHVEFPRKQRKEAEQLQRPTFAGRPLRRVSLSADSSCGLNGRAKR